MQAHAFVEVSGARDRLRFAIIASFAVALLLAAIIFLGGLLIPSLYARETENWSVQATGQDSSFRP